jgi:hypothetical protein
VEAGAAVAGVCHAIYPVALTLAAGGFPEIPYVLIAGIGLLLILRESGVPMVGPLCLASLR